MDFSHYQRAASETNELPPSGPANAIGAMLGLASESGSILNVYKQFLRRNIDLEANVDFMAEELGDLLWYLAAVASAFRLDLGDVAASNLARTRDYYLDRDEKGASLAALPTFDEDVPVKERLPRRMTFQFVDGHDETGRAVATIAIIAAEPFAFPDGPESLNHKRVGFSLGSHLGDQLTDNSRRADGYRFHDAIHLGFCAVLGWSPTIRDMLRLKRKSIPAIDEAEDGARAVFSEEGLAAMLAKLSIRRLGFQAETNVDMETIEVARAVVADLECAELPAWVWRRAICQGFRAMAALESNRGGFLLLDLDKRTLEYRRVLTEDVEVTGSDLDRASLVSTIAALHTVKDAAYRDAWKRRGEVVGIVANIARKADRLENALDGAPDTPDETHLDTAIDLFVYAVKYRAFLADQDEDVDRRVFGDRPEGRGRRSDGPTFVNDLLEEYAGSMTRAVDLASAGASTLAAFNRVIESVSQGDWPTASVRLDLATDLAGRAWALVLAYASASPAAVEALRKTVNAR